MAGEHATQHATAEQHQHYKDKREAGNRSFPEGHVKCTLLWAVADTGQATCAFRRIDPQLMLDIDQ